MNRTTKHLEQGRIKLWKSQRERRHQPTQQLFSVLGSTAPSPPQPSEKAPSHPSRLVTNFFTLLTANVFSIICTLKPCSDLSHNKGGLKVVVSPQKGLFEEFYVMGERVILPNYGLEEHCVALNSGGAQFKIQIPVWTLVQQLIRKKKNQIH